MRMMQVDREDLVQWLQDEGGIDGPEFKGHGHITADDLADRLLSAFVIYPGLRDDDPGPIETGPRRWG